MTQLSDRDRKLLWVRSHDRCAFPQCRQPLTVDQQDVNSGEEFQTVIGEEAHIYSASAAGPRYDPAFPKAKLETYENRILLCRNHHRFIDSEKGRAYDPATLIAMKNRHEKQEEIRETISGAIGAYVADRYLSDDRVLFRQVRLDGPRVDDMFVDVPFAVRENTQASELLTQIAATRPGDTQAESGLVVTGAAQALLHPDWKGNALVVGGPGQGKSTLLQYICQFHRARWRGENDYTGSEQRLQPLTTKVRVPIRIDLRDYAEWAATKMAAHAANEPGPRTRHDYWPKLEKYIAWHIADVSAKRFKLEALTTLLATEPVLLALDGLDEVADLGQRDRVSTEIIRAASRMQDGAFDLVLIVASRPGLSKSQLWSSDAFPIFYLQRLTPGLRLQYLQRWCEVTNLEETVAAKLQRTFLEHEELPHIRDLASYPMQLAILLHLLHRRGLLPQERTELYREYLRTFLDREESDDKEPLLSSQREIIEDIHAYLGWVLQKQAEDSFGSGRIAREDLQELLVEYFAGRPQGAELADQLFAAMESRVLCLIEREPGYFQFEVQSLREFFAAAYVYDYVDPRSRIACFDALLGRPYWLNTCRFFVGMFTKFEVRGINQSLTELHESPEYRGHPHLRAAAARLLEDRAYQGQTTATMQGVVDFVLSDSGVLLAETGALDESGRHLLLPEDAGRDQAVLHLRNRLESELHPGLRRACASALFRHSGPSDQIRSWWWGRFETTDSWLETAADLGILADQSPEAISHLEELFKSELDDQDRWRSERLLAGGWNGTEPELVAACKKELNEGAIEVLTFGQQSPLGALVAATRLALGRHQSPPLAAKPRSRRRSRGNDTVTDFSKMTAAVQALPPRPPATAGAAAWAKRLQGIYDVWGSGWILDQSIALIPTIVDLSQCAGQVNQTDEDLREAIRVEDDRRQNAGNAEWWRVAHAGLCSQRDRLSWLFSILTMAKSSVIVDLAEAIDDEITELLDRDYRALEQALLAFSQAPHARSLVLREPIRRSQVAFGARGLWLLRHTSTDETVTQIDKRLSTIYPDLLVRDLGDRRDLLGAAAAAGGKVIKAADLRGTRAALPRPWPQHLKVGAISKRLAGEILESPQDWPDEVVGRAIQEASAGLRSLKSVARLAEDERWFPGG